MDTGFIVLGKGIEEIPVPIRFSVVGEGEHPVSEKEPSKLIQENNPGTLVYWDYSDVAPNEAVVLLIEEDNYGRILHRRWLSWRLLAAGTEAEPMLMEMSGKNYALTLDMQGKSPGTVNVARISLEAGFSPVVFRLEKILLSIF